MRGKDYIRTAWWTLEEKILGQRGGHMKEKYQDSEMDTRGEKDQNSEVDTGGEKDQNSEIYGLASED